MANWTDEEVNIIKESYERYKSYEYAYINIPYRGRREIRTYGRKKLGLNVGIFRNLSNNEINIIKESHEKFGNYSYAYKMLPHRSRGTIKRCGKTFGRLKEDKAVWAESEDQILRENFLENNRWEIFKKLIPYRSRRGIKARLAKLGLKNRIIFSKNEEFFDIPNIKNCTVAGLFAADACISDSYDHNTRLQLVFTKKDFEYWNQIKELIGYNGNYYIKDWERNFDFVPSRKAYISKGTSCHLTISNADRWVENLNKYWNITPRKTYTLLPPNLTDLDQIFAYISGLIDGDGSIYFGSSKDLRICILGTEKLLNWVKYYFDFLVPFATGGRIKKDKDGEVFRYAVSGLKVYALVKYFLSLDVLRMDRKWDRVKDFVKTIEDKPLRQFDINKFNCITDEKLHNLLKSINFKVKNKQYEKKQ